MAININDSKKTYGSDVINARYNAAKELEEKVSKLRQELTAKQKEFEQKQALKVEDVLEAYRQARNVEIAKRQLELQVKNLDFIYGLEARGLSDNQKQKEKFEKLLAKIKKTDELDAVTEAHKKNLANLEEQAKKRKEWIESTLEDPFATLKEKFDAFIAGFKDSLKEGLATSLEKTINGIANLGQTLSSDMNETMSKYAEYSKNINTRLQGRSTNDTFKSIESYYSSTVGVTPYIKTEKLMDNLTSLVQSGIAFNVEQRAFLETVKEEVAQTFDAASASLLRIVKLQQEDSTASRLGMEAYLTSFLNNQFENTEYLQQTYDDVQAALVEAVSQMDTEAGVEFEYIVQKWLSSLSSVGMSTDAVNSLAEAIGYLGSGDVESLANSSMQNLIVMGANKAGLSYGELLTGGLTASNTEQLLESIVDYMQEISQTTADNNVVASQFSKTFGISISDLTAVANLTAEDVKTISDSTMSYADTITELGNQLNEAGNRLTTEGLLSNLYDNSVFQAGVNIASNPALYSLWKVTSMIEDLTGGIALPTVSVMGNSVDLNTTVTNLMRTGIVGAGSLGMIGDIIGGLGDVIGSVGGYSGNFGSVLDKLNITSTPTATTRGSGLSRRLAGLTTGASSFVGNSSSSDLYEQALVSANEQTESAMADVQEQTEESPEYKTNEYLENDLDAKVDTIINLLTRQTYGYDNGLISGASALLNKGSSISVVSSEEDENKITDNLKALTEYTRNINDMLSRVISGTALNVTVEKPSWYNV